jgi:hypothetical protein
MPVIARRPEADAAIQRNFRLDDVKTVLYLLVLSHGVAISQYPLDHKMLYKNGLPRHFVPRNDEVG